MGFINIAYQFQSKVELDAQCNKYFDCKKIYDISNQIGELAGVSMPYVNFTYNNVEYGTTQAGIVDIINNCACCKEATAPPVTCDVLRSNETLYIDGPNTVTLLANSVYSYQLIVDEDEVSFAENGITAPFNYYAGKSEGQTSPNPCKYLLNEVVIAGLTADSKATIKIIR